MPNQTKLLRWWLKNPNQVVLLVEQPGSNCMLLVNNFAKGVVCVAKPSKNLFCDGCWACEKVNHATYQDLVVVNQYEQTFSKSQLTSWLQDLLYQGLEKNGHRFFVVYGIEMLSAETTSLLLTFLEKIPKHLSVVLTTRNPYQLLPTLTSRCQTFRLAPQLSLLQQELSELAPNLPVRFLTSFFYHKQELVQACKQGWLTELVAFANQLITNKHNYALVKKALNTFKKLPAHQIRGLLLYCQALLVNPLAVDLAFLSLLKLAQSHLTTNILFNYFYDWLLVHEFRDLPTMHL